MTFLYKYRLLILGIALGACSGYLYYHFIGCTRGTCIITSKPFNSTVYGAVMGGFIADIFHKKQNRESGEM